jgi:hypothetical protein
MSGAHGPVIDARISGVAPDHAAAGSVQLMKEALECST